MGYSVPTFGLPQGAGRSAFDASARGFEASRQKGSIPAVTTEAPSVEGAIANAARQTGVDFSFLLAQAWVESALDPAAKARTSSATGLYQFIESTWLDTMKRHGARFGMGTVAGAIAVGRHGGAYVADPALRSQILAMRNDPQVAAWMAAGLAEDNASHLMPILGRQPDHTELYLAHFLGAGGAGRFFSAMQEYPQQSAAALFGKAAAANTPIFYEADGSPRSLAGVMSHLTAKMEQATGPATRGGSRPVAVQLPAPVQPAFVASAPTPGLPADRAAPVPLSDVLNATFGVRGASGEASGRAQAHVQRAYSQLRAFRL